MRRPQYGCNLKCCRHMFVEARLLQCNTTRVPRHDQHWPDVHVMQPLPPAQLPPNKAHHKSAHANHVVCVTVSNVTSAAASKMMRERERGKFRKPLF